MREQLSDSYLESKSVEELRAMLADERLLDEGDAANDLIFKIAEAIHAKERKTENQLEAERVKFWAGLVARYDEKIPITIEDVVRERKVPEGTPKTERFAYRWRANRVVRRSAMAAAIALIIVLGNTIAALAFNFNLLRVVVNFTDDVLVKTIQSKESAADSENSANADGMAAEYATLQDALDAFGITRPHAPESLPKGFEFDFVQTAEQSDSVHIVAQYHNGERAFTISIISYLDSHGEITRYVEKNAGNPTAYSYSGIEFSIFNNLERTVATWVDGTLDCTIQGNVSEKEIKSIIKSIYTEDQNK